MAILVQTASGGFALCKDRFEFRHWAVPAERMKLGTVWAVHKDKLNFCFTSADAYDWDEVFAALTSTRPPPTADIYIDRRPRANAPRLAGSVPGRAPMRASYSHDRIAELARAEQARVALVQKRIAAIDARRARETRATAAGATIITALAGSFHAQIDAIAQAVTTDFPVIRLKVSGFEFIDTERMRTESVTVQVMLAGASLVPTFYLHYHDNVGTKGPGSRMHFKADANPAATTASVTYEDLERSQALKNLRGWVFAALQGLRPKTSAPGPMALQKRRQNLLMASGKTIPVDPSSGMRGPSDQKLWQKAKTDLKGLFFEAPLPPHP